MPVSKFTCPECEAVLRPAKPLPAGKRVICPKCKANFVVRDPDEETAKKTAKATAPNDDGFDDDGPGTYAVIKEAPKEEEIEDEEDEEDEDDEDEDRPRRKKPKKTDVMGEDLAFRLNIKVTDPRGPAQAALVSPSNFLMLVGTLALIAGVLAVAYGAWPFLFMETILDPVKYFKAEKAKDSEAKDGEAPKKQRQSIPVDAEGKIDVEKLPQELKTKYYDALDEEWWTLVLCMVIGGAVIAYNATIIIGGVKMQNMESYTFAMIAAIMAFGFSFPGLGQIAGLMAVTTLRSKKVVDGYFYIPPSATPKKKLKKRDVL